MFMPMSLSGSEIARTTRGRRRFDPSLRRPANYRRAFGVLFDVARNRQSKWPRASWTTNLAAPATQTAAIFLAPEPSARRSGNFKTLSSASALWYGLADGLSRRLHKHTAAT